MKAAFFNNFAVMLPKIFALTEVNENIPSSSFGNLLMKQIELMGSVENDTFSVGHLALCVNSEESR